MSPGLSILGICLSFIAAFVPTAFWSALVWWCDRFEREPISLITASFLWGAFPAVALAFGISTLFGAPAGISSSLPGWLIRDSMMVPLIEEYAKGIALVLIVLFWHVELDGVLDGILYGAMVGFGFAMTENTLYYLGALAAGGWSSWGITVFMRGVIFGLNHAFFTAFTGAGLGYARMAARGWERYGIALFGLALAVCAHAVHNAGASLADRSASGIFLSLASDAGGIIVIMVLMGRALQEERKWLRVELADEVGKWLSHDEYELLSSFRGRWQMLVNGWRRGGLPAAWQTGRYHQLATELAFRKHRARKHPTDHRATVDIAQLQQQLAEARPAAI